jgi:hypothetical protein
MNIEPGIYRPEFPMDGNFTMVPNVLIRDPDLTPTAKLLMIYLFSHKIGYVILDDQIIRETGLGRHALRSARSNLEELGFIEVVRIRHDDNSWGGYRYELADPKGYFSTVDYSTVASSTVESSTMENQPDNRRLISNKTKEKKTNKDNTGEFEELFEVFWKAYPKKADKALAYRSYEKALKRANAERILEGAQQYRDDPRRDDAYTKNPSTWLNADAWENPPIPAPKTKHELVEEQNRRVFEKYQTGNDFGLSLKSPDEV